MKVLNKLLFWSLCGNYWLWFHMLAGAILGKVGILFFSKTLTISLIAILAMIWEIVEYYLECGGDIKKIQLIYGSKERWVYDCIGDVLGAILMAGIVVM
jgi:hypothetical protein